MAVSTTETTASSRNSWYQFDNYMNDTNKVCEILEEKEEEEEEEEYKSEELFEINHDRFPMYTIEEESMEGSDCSVFSLDLRNLKSFNAVYVGVGKTKSSMDAVSWTLNHAVKSSSTVVFLVHVFPQLHLIPSPLGLLPKSRVNPEQINKYMAIERGKRTQLINKFVTACSARKVKVDTIFLESNKVAKAMLDLVSILNITKLVLGADKSNIRKLKSKRGHGIVDEIMQNAPKTCEVNIVCEAKEVIFEPIISLPTITQSPSPSPSPRGYGNINNLKTLKHEDTHDDYFSCICFKSRFRNLQFMWSKIQCRENSHLEKVEEEERKLMSNSCSPYINNFNRITSL